MDAFRIDMPLIEIQEHDDDAFILQPIKRPEKPDKYEIQVETFEQRTLMS